MWRSYVKSIFLHNIMLTVVHFSPVNREDFQLKGCMSAKITLCLTTEETEDKSRPVPGGCYLSPLVKFLEESEIIPGISLTDESRIVTLAQMICRVWFGHS